MDREDSNPVAKPFSKREEEILDFWHRAHIFEKSLKAREGSERYTFYDGPPFATGTPHYGHILASAIKDAVPRYQTMRGKYVARRWGWDCHGLPIENIVEKDLKISGKKDIEKLGIGKFNQYAKSKVLEYVGEWKRTVTRMARWVDFDGSYKTMDNTYIESVWWALAELNDKELIYEGTRVLPYCSRCETPIAQSEIAMDNSYKDIRDISVYVKFKLINEPDTYLLAWTTTPWTLPGNTAAAVNPDINYVYLKYFSGEWDNGKPVYQTAILSEAIYQKVSQGTEPHPLYAALGFLSRETPTGNEKPESPTIIKTVKGSELVGLAYQPIFDYYAEKDFPNKENAWKVYPADYVTPESGSGIVHLAPAFGEEDMALAKQFQIPHITHVGRDGKFLSEVTDLAGELVKPKDDHQRTDILVIKKLAADGTLFAKESILHSYPHCFRCETPLIYYALPAWFVKIQEIKDQLILHNEEINWVPEYLKHGRFLKSMEAAPDWNISRNRFWASPLPIWKCVDCEKTRFVKSGAEFADQIVGRNKFYFVRHGEAEKDLSQILDYDEVGSPLTERGREQMRQVAQTVKDYGITKIVASPVIRTKETAEIFSQALNIPVEFDSRLRELDFGDWRGTSSAAWRSNDTDSTERWLTGPPNGESWSTLQRRMADAVADINSQNKGETILVVSHGDPLYVLYLRLAGVTEYVGRESDMAYPMEAVVTEKEVTLFDFHRPYIDEITFTCACGGQMHRIPEVVDCWFESASMPFAANHYPFERADSFSDSFPGDFVAEYIAQTRTWFYYMHVLSTILFDSAPFRNVITTGTILAEDGQKMSKSKQNFPDPWLVFEKYGVDALRFHLLGSSLLKAEDMNFSESELADVFKKHILRLQNVVAFYELYPVEAETEQLAREHILDRWVVQRLADVTGKVTTAMDRYELDQALRPVGEFIDDLSVWYVRRSRERMKDERREVSEPARQTLRHVLSEFSKVLAPFVPFSAEMLYQAVRRPTDCESVHLEDWPTPAAADEKLLSQMDRVRRFVELGHADRNVKKIKLRQPLQKVTLTGITELESPFIEILLEELNVKEVVLVGGEALGAEVDPALTPALEREGMERDLLRQIQGFRKFANLMVGESATIIWQSKVVAIGDVLRDARFMERLESTTLVEGSVSDELPIFFANPDNSLQLGISKKS